MKVDTNISQYANCFLVYKLFFIDYWLRSYAPIKSKRQHPHPLPRVWLAKCCKIQQLAHSYSTTYIYVQQDIFIFNILYLYSTMRIFFQLQPKLFSFNKNICSTSTKHNFIQQQYLFNFNPNYFHSTKIFVQLQPNIISFNKYVCSTSTRNNFIQQRSSRTFKISSFNKIPHPVPS